MRSYAQEARAAEQAVLAKSRLPSGAHPGLGRDTDSVLQLQRVAGNHAVQLMLRRAGGLVPLQAPANGAPALTVSQPVGRHEREADRVAEQLTQGPGTCEGECAPGPAEPKDAGQVRLQPLRGVEGEPRRGAAPAGVREALAAPGRPLDAGTRSLMEERFGADFSGVRVYTDAAAAQSARELNARAYTAGRDIVFGAGEFRPRTQAGRRLLAHELAHVVQQSGGRGMGRIQRKEISGSIYDTLRKRPPPQDWYAQHREAWQHASHTGTERMLHPANTFMRAAWYNTVNLRPGEYQTVTERHDYYDLISYVIEYDRNTPKAASGVRFFHAATAVTGSPGIGSVDKPIGYIKLGAGTRTILREVNAELFALNMGVIRNLLSNWKEPRDPQTGGGRINAFDFDIRMVETEQGVVENYIAQNKASFTPAVVQEINATLDPTAFGQYFNFSQRAFEWAIAALGVPALDFTIQAHRQAIGFASVHIFHRKSRKEYLAFMQQRAAPVRPPNQYSVGGLNGITLNEDLPGPWQVYDLPVGTTVEVIDHSHLMGPHLPDDIYAGKVEVRVLDGTHQGKTGWTDFDNLW
jgi:hypothetical protein